MYITRTTIFLLLLQVSIAFPATAASRRFFGRISDKTGNGIPGAHIKVDEHPEVFYCNANGVFSFSYNAGPDDLFVIGSQGFENKEIFASDLIKDSIFIVLDRSITRLAGAGISAKNGRLLKGVSGCDRNSHSASAYMSMYDEIALFCPVDKARNAILKEVGAYVTKEGAVRNQFKLHLYLRDSATGAPGEEITDTMLYMAARKGNEWVTVDLSNFLIQVKNGLFLSMEWIPGATNDYFSWEHRDWKDNYYAGNDSLRTAYHGQVLGMAWDGNDKPVVYRRYATNKYIHKDEDKWFRTNPLKGGRRLGQWICPMLFISYTYLEK
jgi:hypothetical protein